MITIDVDNVKCSNKILPTIPWNNDFYQQMSHENHYFEPSIHSIDIFGMQPLLMAVHLAYTNNTPVTITPDAFWLTLTQGATFHLRNNDEFKTDIFSEPTQCNNYSSPLDLEAINAKDLKNLIANLKQEIVISNNTLESHWFECNFSTSTKTSIAVSELIELNYRAHYNDYIFSTIKDYILIGNNCGIPKITIEGTIEDWMSIRDRLSLLADIELDEWYSSLTRIVDQFINVFNGNIELKFWQEIYCAKQYSDSSRIAGWIGRLFPIISGNIYNKYYYNALLKITHEEAVSSRISQDSDLLHYLLDPMAIPIFLPMLSISSSNGIVGVAGGLCGVSQDSKGHISPFCQLATTSEYGFHYRMDKLIDRMFTEKIVEQTSTDLELHTSSRIISELYTRLNGATLNFGENSWEILPAGTWVTTSLTDETGLYRQLECLIVFRLGNGEGIAHCGSYWLLLPSNYCTPDSQSEKEIGEIHTKYQNCLLLRTEAVSAIANIRYKHEADYKKIFVTKNSLDQIFEYALDNDGHIDKISSIFDRFLSFNSKH